MTDRARLIAVARGDAEPDLVVRGARVFSAFTREWLDGDVAVADGRIAGVGAYGPAPEELDGTGRCLVPGFVDAHVHIESSKLVPAEFARAILPHGTTTVVTDPHEVANVLGLAGIRWMLEATEGLPLRVYVMAPSCVPASRFETPRAPLGPDGMAAVLEHPRALGIAEVMDFPGVVAADPALLAKLALPGATHADGHAPGLRGAALDAYAAAGISSDHEATTWEEALDKRRRGMWILLREASGARDLEALLELVRRHGPQRCAFCTDDREPETLLREGHLDGMCRAAVAQGVAAEDALVMATLHGAQAHGLRDLGAIAPGFRADLVLLEDLTDFRAAAVIAGGRVVARDGVAVAFDAPPVPAVVLDTVHVAPLTVADLALGAAPGDVAPRVRVVDVVPGSLVTGAGEAEALVRDGAIVADPGRDLAKLAVVERHHASGAVGVGLARGFGLRAGAFASTVAHDAHNVVVVGVDDASMLACVQRLADLGGGIAVARDGVVVGEQPLPVAGLLTDQPVEAVVERMDALTAILAELGVTVPTPFMSLSFLALSVIPALKVSDQGIVDVERFELVDLTLY